jgi:hypothetical protein
MSVTVPLLSTRVSQVPAVAHIDGSARLQTVTQNQSPLLHLLLTLFHALTGVPMLLNTSLNRNSEPIVETSREAVKCFIAVGGELNAVYVGRYSARFKPYKEACPALSRVGATSVIAYAQPIYLSEEVRSANELVRIRVQDGAENEWKELPSELHWTILQLLQPDSVSGEEGVCVSDLCTAVIHSDAENTNDGKGEALLIQDIDNALEWLYNNTLVYFEQDQ